MNIQIQTELNALISPTTILTDNNFQEISVEKAITLNNRTELQKPQLKTEQHYTTTP